MNKLKGIEKLDNIITSFFEQLGYDEITCFMATDFAYYGNTNEISYTLFEMPLYDIGFKKYLKNHFPNMKECSVFLVSLLHELGHHLTWDGISKKQKLKGKKMKKRLERRRDYTSEDIIQKQIDYCNIYEERIATAKAVEILEEKYNIIVNFEEVWFNAVMDFYRENSVDFSE